MLNVLVQNRQKTHVTSRKTKLRKYGITVLEVGWLGSWVVATELEVWPIKSPDPTCKEKTRHAPPRPVPTYFFFRRFAQGFSFSHCILKNAAGRGGRVLKWPPRGPRVRDFYFQLWEARVMCAHISRPWVMYAHTVMCVSCMHVCLILMCDGVLVLKLWYCKQRPAVF